ncbi:MAG: hypothetical protein OEZ68_10365 [Gammaproteobacteria bacterium]|nr:hypothetical protein [Gammaproteobacteria bacterium]MDH5801194.1 hypothetical protein [Gammaproteobacteria bacterium]
MFGLPKPIRWIFIFLGGAIILLDIVNQRDMLSDHPAVENFLFPHIWVVGLALIFLGYGFEKDNNKHSGSGGVDGAPGMGEKKNSPFGDHSSSDGGD